MSGTYEYAKSASADIPDIKSNPVFVATPSYPYSLLESTQSAADKGIHSSPSFSAAFTLLTTVISF